MRTDYSQNADGPDLPNTIENGQVERKKPETRMESLETPDDNERGRCGWYWLRPNCLQKFRTAKWALFWLCWAGGIQGMVVNGLLNIALTTIERRFGLRSAQTGSIVGAYDVASFFIVVPISYLGGRATASKPRYLGIGILILGLGCLIFASPHYMAGNYRSTEEINDTCQPRTNSSSSLTTCDANDSPLEANSGLYFAIFLIAQLLNGAGAAPLFTLGVTYIDENVTKKMSSVYIGIFYTMTVVGPALGYVFGGELLKIYVDYPTIDPIPMGLTPESNVWIGAWWIGFLASFVVCTLIAIPMLAFPAALPGSEKFAQEKNSEAHSQPESTTTSAAFTKISALPKAVVALVKNPAFVMLNFAGASEGFIVAGFAAFLPKLIENQFNVSASMAALLMGAVTVPAGGGGTFLGGYVIKRLNLQCAQILKFCLFTTAICCIFTLCFVLSCPNVDFAGLTVPYSDGMQEVLSLNSTCNADCGCTRSNFDPLCGADGITYYSPCYAGCSVETSMNDVKIYNECKCIRQPPMNFTVSEQEGYVASYEAINTKCPSSCNFLWVFIVMAFCNMFFTFVCTMPALSATLRVVRDQQRSVALGIQWIKVRILGTIPAPVIFGALIDQTCILWHESCDDTGSCLVYDNYYLSRYMFALGLGAKLLSLLFFTLAWKLYIPPAGRTVEVESPRAAERLPNEAIAT